MIEDYVILRDVDPYSLEREVKARLKDGYDLYGPLSVLANQSVIVYCQVVVLCNEGRLTNLDIVKNDKMVRIDF